MMGLVVDSNVFLGNLGLIQYFKKASKLNVSFLRKNLQISKLERVDKVIFKAFINFFRVQVRKGHFVKKGSISVFHSFFRNLEKLKVKINLNKNFFNIRFPVSKILLAPVLRKKQFFFRGLGSAASYLKSFRDLKKLVKKSVPKYDVYKTNRTKFPFLFNGPFGPLLYVRDQSKYVNFLGSASRYLSLSRNLVKWLSTSKRSFFSVYPSFRSNFSLIKNSFFDFFFLTATSKRFILKKMNFFFKKRFFRKDVLYGLNRFVLKSGWFDKVYRRRYGIKIKRYKDLHLSVLNFFKNFVFLKIQNSVNNLFLTAVDMFGNTIGWLSLGSAGSKNAVKKTDYATDVLATKFATKLRFFNIRNLHLHLTMKLNRKVKNVLRGFRKMRIRVNVVTVHFTTPHNGLRRNRRRRK